MGFLDSHVQTSVSSTINELIEQTQRDEMEDEMPNLLEMIRLQNDIAEPGPKEAARAVRKKLKYGTNKAKYNALNLLDLLVSNGGEGRMILLYTDHKLLDRMVVIAGQGAESTTDPHVVKRARALITQWRQDYEGIESRESLVRLYQKCGLAKMGGLKRSYAGQVPDFMADEADLTTPFGEDSDEERGSSTRSPPPRRSRYKPMSNKELNKKFKIPKINYQKAGPRIEKAISFGNMLAEELQKILRNLAPGELSIHSADANDCFDECRKTRRKILRYLQLVDREDLLGELLKCNDALVTALKRYETLSAPPAPLDAEDESDDSLANYETDDSLDDGLDDRFDQTAFAPAEDAADEPPATPVVGPEEATPTASPAPPVKKRPPIPAKSSALRTGSPVVRTESADPFGDGNEVDKPTVWS